MEEDIMWIEACLKMAFYQPEKIEKGMWFLNSLYPGTDKEFVEIWELDEDVPETEYDGFFAKNGFPVEPMITLEQQNPDEPDDIIVFPNAVGLFLENEKLDVITIKQMNNIIENYGGKVFLLIKESMYNEDYTVVPETEDDLAILTYPFEEEFDEDLDLTV